MNKKTTITNPFSHATEWSDQDGKIYGTSLTMSCCQERRLDAEFERRNAAISQNVMFNDAPPPSSETIRSIPSSIASCTKDILFNRGGNKGRLSVMNGYDMMAMEFKGGSCPFMERTKNRREIPVKLA